MTAIVEPNLARLGILQAMLHGSVALESMEQLSEHISHNPQEFAVVIGPSIAVEAAVRFAEWARIGKPDLGVIMLRERVDSEALSAALRSGMREVVDARDLAGIATAVSRVRTVSTAIAATLEEEANAAAAAAMAEAEAEAAAARAAADRPTGRLITVFSTKGGVGKSLMATNLAVSLSEADSSVCLVDLDVNGGDVAIMLQLNPLRTINDLVAYRGEIDRDAVDTLVTPFSPSLGVIAAPVHLDSPEHASTEDVGKLLEVLVRLYDFVVVDTSGSFDDHALNALDRTDLLVLVGTLDIPALKGLKLATQTLDLLGFPKERRRFVLNRADAKVGLTTEEFESTLSLKADCSLVSSREVLAAVNRGVPLVKAYSSHPNSKAIRSFAAGLSTALNVSDGREQDPPASRGSRFRLRKG